MTRVAIDVIRELIIQGLAIGHGHRFSFRDIAVLKMTCPAVVDLLSRCSPDVEGQGHVALRCHIGQFECRFRLIGMMTHHTAYYRLAVRAVF